MNKTPAPHTTRVQNHVEASYISPGRCLGLSPHLFAYLECRDLARLDTALPSAFRAELIHAQTLSLAVVLSPNAMGEEVIWKWFWAKSMHLVAIQMKSGMEYDFDALVSNSQLVDGIDLTVTGQKDLHDGWFTPAMESLLCTKVTCLHLRRGDFGGQELPASTYRSYRNLQELSINSIRLDFTWLTNVLDANPGLNAFTYRNSYLNGRGFQSLIPFLRNIACLKLVEARVNDQDLNLVSQHCQGLLEFELCSLLHETEGGILTNKGILWMAQRCPLLQKVTVSVNFETENTVLAFVSHCPDLRELVLWGGELTDAALQAAATHSPHLRKLHVYWAVTSEATVHGARQLLENLTVLHFRFDDIRAPKEAHHITAVLACRCLSQIQDLQAEACFLASRTDNMAAAIAAHCTHLRELDLWWYGKTAVPCGDQGIALLEIAHQNSATLRKLKLWCDNDCVRLPQVLAMVQALPMLATLDLYIAQKDRVVGDQIICAVAETCPLLCRMEKLRYFMPTDRGVLALAEHCPLLTKINLERCEQVTEAALLQLVRRCRKLVALILPKTIEADACERIKQAANEGRVMNKCDVQQRRQVIFEGPDERLVSV